MAAVTVTYGGSGSFYDYPLTMPRGRIFTDTDGAGTHTLAGTGLDGSVILRSTQSSGKITLTLPATAAGYAFGIWTRVEKDQTMEVIFVSPSSTKLSLPELDAGTLPADAKGFTVDSRDGDFMLITSTGDDYTVNMTNVEAGRVTRTA